MRNLLRRLGRHELGSMLSVLVIAGGTLLFAQVLSEVAEGSTHALDRALLIALRNPADPADPIGPKWLEQVGRDLSALGGVTALTLFTTAAVGYLVLIRKRHAAGLVLVSVLGAALLNSVLKQAVGRPRPDVATHLVHVSSASFPSGHSMVAAAVYLTLGALLARLEPNLVVKAYVLLWALLLSFLVGVSRVYVGVHWPSDVLAGWAAGAAWAALCWLLATRLQARGAVEAPQGVDG